jgi:flagellar motor switch protein FliN/FliY
MKPLALRRLHGVQGMPQALLARWQRAGVQACLLPLDSAREHLHFNLETGEGRWQGMIDAGHWLADVQTQLPALLPADVHLAAAQALFDALADPLSAVSVAPRDAPSWDSVPAWLAQGRVKRLSGGPLESPWPASLPGVGLGRGTLWFASPPPSPPARSDLPAWLHDVPLPMHLVLGRSALPAAALLGWQPGDVLVLARRTDELWLAERPLGLFSLTAEGFKMLDTALESPGAAEDNTPHAPGAMPAGAEEAGLPATDQHEPTSACTAWSQVEPLPVTVEFILHTGTLTLAELGQWQAGQVLPLPEDAHGRVQVRVNGQVRAVGELVQLEAGLGVELQSVGGSLQDE